MAICKVLAAFISLVSLLSTVVQARERTSPAVVQLTVSVFNDARLPAKVLHSAQNRAEFIFQRAGVVVTWLDCGDPKESPSGSGCAAISFPDHLSVRVVPTGSPASAEAFGESFQDADGLGSYACVYAASLRSPATAAFLGEGDLLGNVIAHELGHLLLGPNSHSSLGLMSARWTPAELQRAAKGLLVFAPEEAVRLRARYVSALAYSKLDAAPVR